MTDRIIRQCIFSVFGGHVDVTGEILHGKTSPLRHDSKGVYTGLAQDLPVTRYHSLAGTHTSLPDCLEVTSWISSGPDGGKGIIMGVRHRELLVEGVQFHPESILTAQGRLMLRNFLTMRGGTWAENERLQHPPNGDTNQNDAKSVNSRKTTESILAQNGAHQPQQTHEKKDETILEKIFRHRKLAVNAQKLVPSLRQADLQASYDLNISPPQISFPDRLKQSSFSLSLMAEFKRASPSKGVISLELSATAQGRKYALAGASAISVLTEPEWFKGSIEDLRSVRQVLEGMPNRPAVLRKEFIFDEYQILEARLAGADTVLLIVKMLDEATLKRLYVYSQSLGMEPLVEVNTPEEMSTAMEIGAQVVGVNNRNLASFEVDLQTTSRLMQNASKGTIICALSGISSSADIRTYQEGGVSAVLVGEALMRATDAERFIAELLGGSSDGLENKNEKADLLVKICGTRTSEAARTAIESGADFIGIILVEGRKRYVSHEDALEISKTVHRTSRPTQQDCIKKPLKSSARATDYFDYMSATLYHPDRALLVGVFQNQPLEYILAKQRALDLDIVQLHGSEPIEWAALIPVPVIRRFGPNDHNLGRRGYHALPLIDSELGGTGQTSDIPTIMKALDSDNKLRIILAGGLTAGSIKNVMKDLRRQSARIAAVDVSTGVEENGVQSLAKIREFITAARVAYQDS